MYSAIVLATLASAATVSAAKLGFSYGSSSDDGTPKTQSDFEAEFSTAQGLVGASGFTSARLYTMLQAGTASDPTEAIPAAIATKTTLLLGLWASGGSFQNEIDALTSAISKYGSSFTSIIDGISVGSEDLYRDAQSASANAGVGASATTIVGYIKQVRAAIANTGLSGAAVGHVDIYSAWANTSNTAVAEACDWVGLDAYPYFQTSNAIGKAAALFTSDLSATQSAVGSGKPVWVTETGWPVSGDSSGDAVASLANAKTYWDQVGCALLFGTTNTWWYTLQQGTSSDPSFGVVGSGTLSTSPLFDLSCDGVNAAQSSSSSSASPTSTKQTSASLTSTTDQTSTSATQAQSTSTTETKTTTRTTPSQSSDGSTSTDAAHTPSATAEQTSSPTLSSGLGAGPIAGIVVGVVGAFLIGILVAFFYFRRSGGRRKDGGGGHHGASELGGQPISEAHGKDEPRTFPGTESTGWGISEMDAAATAAGGGDKGSGGVHNISEADHAAVIRNVHELPATNF